MTFGAVRTFADPLDTVTDGTAREEERRLAQIAYHMGLTQIETFAVRESVASTLGKEVR